MVRWVYGVPQHLSTSEKNGTRLISTTQWNLHSCETAAEGADKGMTKVVHPSTSKTGAPSTFRAMGNQELETWRRRVVPPGIDVGHDGSVPAKVFWEIWDADVCT